MSDNMGKKVSGAARSQAVTALAGKAINLLLGIVLARLLLPEDYGLFTIALIVIGLANLVSNFGFQSYIIQAKSLSQQEINICFTLNMGMSALLGSIVASIGFFWSDSSSYLATMFVLYGFFIFISGLSYIRLALLKRDLDFAASSRADLAYTVVSMGGRVGFAAAGLGALCFPLGDALGALVRWLLVTRLSTVVPRLEMPSRASSREVIRFGAHATSVGMASFVANQSDKALVTINHPVAAVGLYGFGSNTAAMFYNAFIVPQTSVFLATFARLRDDLEEARRVVAVATRLIFSLALPLNILWLLETERLLNAVFGPQWLAAAPLVRIFAVDYLIRSMVSGITGMQMSFGLAAAAARTKWTNAAVFVGFLLLATWLQVDITGYAIAYVAANIVATVHNLCVNGRLLQIRWIPYLANLMPPAVIAVVSTLAWWVAGPYFRSLPLWPALGGLAGTWLLTYALLTAGFNRMVLRTLMAALKAKSVKEGL